MSKRDYYEVLEVLRTSSQDEIQKSYRRKARECHPDRVTENKEEAELKFKEIAEAYSILSDEDKRRHYDQFGHAADNSSSGFDGFDPFADFMRHVRPRGPVPRKGSDVIEEIAITLEEVATGTKRNIVFKTMEQCSTCGGLGIKKSTNKKKCNICKGTGTYVNSVRQGHVIQNTLSTCPNCNGEGSFIDPKDRCEDCKNGFIEKENEIEMTSPQGTSDEIVLIAAHKGSCGINGGPRGNLIVKINVLPHELFERVDDDIYVNVPLTLYEAVVGCSMKVPTIYGDSVEIDIHGGIQSGEKIKVEGFGLKYLRYNKKGDMIVVVSVVTPRPETLDSSQKDNLSQLGEYVDRAKLKGYTNDG